MIIRMPVDNRLLDKIDSVKRQLDLKINGYPEAIIAICDFILNKNWDQKQNLEELKNLLDKLFNFIQEKCKEEKYYQEGFFLELVKFYEKIIHKIEKI